MRPEDDQRRARNRLADPAGCLRNQRLTADVANGTCREPVIIAVVPASSPSVSVVIPTHRRPDRLREALRALADQRRRPQEIIVVRRRDDEPAAQVVARHRALQVTEVVVEEPGVLAAMIAGARRAGGTHIAFLDDDAAPHPDWLERMVACLADDGVGGAGGRDIVTADDALPRTRDVGRITRWGKLMGDHHRATGATLEVDVLKAANMIFRREALALPTGLRGAGAQVHFEVASGLWARNRGWRLIVDPAAQVDHLPGPRFDADARGRPAAAATLDAGHNLTVALLTMRPSLLWRRPVYGLLIGDRGLPGMGRALAAIPLRQWFVVARLVPSLAGQLLGIARYLTGRRVEMVTFGPGERCTPS